MVGATRAAALWRLRINSTGRDVEDFEIEPDAYFVQLTLQRCSEICVVSEQDEVQRQLLPISDANAIRARHPTGHRLRRVARPAGARRSCPQCRWLGGSQLLLSG